MERNREREGRGMGRVGNSGGGEGEKGKGWTSAKRKTNNDSGATRFSFFLNLATGIKMENGLMA